MISFQIPSIQHSLPCYLQSAGYLQEVDGTRLRLPSGVSNVTLQISPGWQEDQEGPELVEASWDAEIGSFHATVDVPYSTRVGNYRISVEPPGAGGNSHQESQPSAAATRADDETMMGFTAPYRGAAAEGSAASGGGGIIATRGRKLSMISKPITVMREEPSGSATFTVADPRPPTADLKVGAARILQGYIDM